MGELGDMAPDFIGSLFSSGVSNSFPGKAWTTCFVGAEQNAFQREPCKSTQKAVKLHQKQPNSRDSI
jgi:hypothetical protein